MQNATYPSRFRHQILQWQAANLDLNYQDISRLTVGRKFVSGQTVKRVLEGDNCGIDTLLAVADTLKIKRESLFDFKLKERDFESAVLNGGSTRRVGR